MTASDFSNSGIQIGDSPTDVLYAETALDWIIHNTSLRVDKSDLSTLPAGAKLFIMRFGDIMKVDSTVVSESLGGMSQSFSSESKNSLLLDLANELMGEYMTSQVKFFMAQNRWN